MYITQNNVADDVGAAVALQGQLVESGLEELLIGAVLCAVSREGGRCALLLRADKDVVHRQEVVGLAIDADCLGRGDCSLVESEGLGVAHLACKKVEGCAGHDLEGGVGDGRTTVGGDIDIDIACCDIELCEGALKIDIYTAADLRCEIDTSKESVEGIVIGGEARGVQGDARVAPVDLVRARIIYISIGSVGSVVVGPEDDGVMVACNQILCDGGRERRGELVVAHPHHKRT